MRLSNRTLFGLVLGLVGVLCLVGCGSETKRPDPLAETQHRVGALEAWRDTTTKRVASLSTFRDSVRVVVVKQAAWDSVSDKRATKLERQVIALRRSNRHLAAELREAKAVSAEISGRLPAERTVDRRELDVLIRRLQDALNTWESAEHH